MRRLTLSLFAVLSLALAACGGEDTLTTKQYKAEAKKICEGAQQRTEAVKQPTKADNKTIITYLRELLKVNERTTQDFEKLEPPESIASEHKRVLDTNRQSVDEVNRLIKELEGGKKAKAVFQANQERLSKVTEDANTAIKSLGVPECGR
jgi:ABC-type glycerol-3-phosphate transport system substrate-binding protein